MISRIHLLDNNGRATFKTSLLDSESRCTLDDIYDKSSDHDALRTRFGTRELNPDAHWLTSGTRLLVSDARWTMFATRIPGTDPLRTISRIHLLNNNGCRTTGTHLVILAKN